MCRRRPSTRHGDAPISVFEAQGTGILSSEKRIFCECRVTRFKSTSRMIQCRRCNDIIVMNVMKASLRVTVMKASLREEELRSLNDADVWHLGS